MNEIPFLLSEIFNLKTGPEQIKPWGEGHINETYLVQTHAGTPNYILQKINRNVFRDVPGMTRNIESVCGHLRQKLSSMPGHDPDRESMTIVPTRSGQAWYEDETGNAWRIYEFIPDTVTHQNIAGTGMAYEAGRAVGAFQMLLSDLGAPLVETIPDFHNIHFRIRQFRDALKNNPAGRVTSAAKEVEFAEARFPGQTGFYDWLRQNATVRVTHNDTKLNNILFDRQGKALCLIDLDTVMPGFVHFDYGDALRTMANTAAEDEKDLDKVRFNLEVYRDFTRGYMEQTAELISPQEIRMLPFAPVYLTFLIGLRFLTDYLNGDVYYRIHYPEHNLVRARVQFKLVKEMEQSLL